MSKLKIKLSIDLDVDSILSGISEKYSKYNPILIDGVFIDFESSWVHLRKSNTEPIIRIFTESKSKEEADKLAKELRLTEDEVYNEFITAGMRIESK